MAGKHLVFLDGEVADNGVVNLLLTDKEVNNRKVYSDGLPANFSSYSVGGG